MPIRTLALNLDTPEDQIFGICDSVGLKGKECNEVYHSLDAIRIWRERFESLYGPLQCCDHHSNPDDPPDLTFRFRDRAIAVEHTRLEPSQYGWMNAIHHKEFPNSHITVPSITQKPKNRQELLAAMFSWSGGWSDLQADLNEWYCECLRVIRKKVEHQPGGILVIQDTSVIFDGQLRPIAEAVHSLLSPRPSLIKDWTVVLHSRSNTLQFRSYLIVGGEELLQLRQH